MQFFGPDQDPAEPGGNKRTQRQQYPLVEEYLADTGRYWVYRIYVGAGKKQPLSTEGGMYAPVNQHRVDGDQRGAEQVSVELGSY